MAQESPSDLIYAQAIQLIGKLKNEYATSKNKTPQEISALIAKTLTDFNNVAGKSLTKFTPVLRSEIPHSAQANVLFNAVQTDTNILQSQVDMLQASAVYMHNFIKTEVLKAHNDNLRVQNKLKTLELYSGVSDDSMVFFGDSFITEAFIDWTMTSDSERASLIDTGYIALSLQSQESVVSSQSKVKILEESNGFMGNNQEVVDPFATGKDPVTGDPLIQFVSETNRYANLTSIIDDRPTTWFEFEKYKVNPADIAQAKDYGFKYVLTGNPDTAYLKTVNSSNPQDQVGTYISWADGPADGLLKLYFEIDLNSDEQVNMVKFLPYGLKDNMNHPVRVVKVLTSLNGTDWQVLGPENVWIANTLDKKISNVNAENISIGSATWMTSGSLIRYIRFEIEQPKAVDCNIGHLFHVPKNKPANVGTEIAVNYPVMDIANLTYDSPIPYDSPIFYGGLDDQGNPVSGGYGSQMVINAGSQDQSVAQTPLLKEVEYRQPGPIPPVDNPQLYYNQKNTVVNDLVQRREYFPGKRWAIGIRDISINKNVYGTKGVLVSNKFNIPGIVDRVAIEADVQIPETYDQDTTWVKFYVSPNDGTNWYQISRIQDDFQSIPEIIAFNDPTPAELRQPGIGYHDVTGTVKSLRVKIEITRPGDEPNSTPIVKSYKLKVIKR